MISYLQYLDAPYLHNAKSLFELVLEIRKRAIQKTNLLSISEKLELSELQRAAIAGVGLRAFRNLKSHDVLSIHSSELVIKLAQLYDLGLETFDRDRESFLKWSKAQIPALGYAIPQEMLNSMLGIEIVRDQLLRMEHGVFA